MRRERLNLKNFMRGGSRVDWRQAVTMKEWSRRDLPRLLSSKSGYFVEVWLTLHGVFLPVE